VYKLEDDEKGELIENLGKSSNKFVSSIGYSLNSNYVIEASAEGYLNNYILINEEGILKKGDNEFTKR